MSFAHRRSRWPGGESLFNQVAVQSGSTSTTRVDDAEAGPSQPVFINELHYDNTGTDVGEFVEIAGPAGTDLAGWTVVFYNGSNGTSYVTLNLVGMRRVARLLGAGTSLPGVNETHDLLRSHRSIRKFSDEPLSDETVAEIVRSGLSAATSSNLQATTVIRVRNPEVRAQIATVAGGQGHIESAGAFMVWCADLHRVGLACEMAGGSMTTGMTEQFIIATVDVALAAQNAVIAAESLGLGICYIGAVRNDPQVVADLLELPDHVYPVFGLCIGHPAQDPEVKPRLPLEAVLKEEVYFDERDRELIEGYDEAMRQYYRSRTGGTKDTSWSEEMARLVEGERRPHMRDFLAKRGFELR